MKLPLLIVPAVMLLGAAQPPPAAPQNPIGNEATDPDATAIGLGRDEAQRMTVPVNIGGSGPYKFVVDTGAERTVIARELAQSLHLNPSGMARLHSMSEVSDIATVLIPTLVVGGKSYRGIKAPALEQRNLGAQGMLGVDALQSQRISFDFPRQEMTVVPSRRHEERWEDGAIVVVGRNRFGHLVLVDAAVEGQKVWVIVDTGAQTSIGNTALRRALERHHRLPEPQPLTMVSVTGGQVLVDQTVVKRLRLGDAEIHDMPIAFGDVEPFRKLDLMNRPAMLLGMDGLKLFEHVSVDFANRRVKLLNPLNSDNESLFHVRPATAGG